MAPTTKAPTTMAPTTAVTTTSTPTTVSPTSAPTTESSGSSETETTESSDSSETTTTESIEYEEEGCYLENYTNPSIDYVRLNLDSAAECIKHCYDNDYVYAAVLNATNFLCSCTNEACDYKSLGTSDLCEDGVGFYAVERSYDRTTMTTTTTYIAALSVYKITSDTSDAVVLSQLDDGGHIRGQVESERDNGNDHIRGQDWEGEDERELIVSHGEIMPTVMMSTNQWTPPFVVLIGVLTVFTVVMIWRFANIQLKWVKDNYVPISDGSGNTGHIMYV